MRYRDARAWDEVRGRNRAWLVPWDATSPDPRAGAVSFRTMVRRYNAQARLGEARPWLLTVNDVLAGQINVAGIVRGSQQGAHIGYWIAREYAGRGYVPMGVAMAIDHCFRDLGLHRVEINIRPENTASLRVVEKLGLRPEGMRRRYLHIDGDWRDHLSFAITAEEVPEGLLARWRRDTPPHLRRSASTEP